MRTNLTSLLESAPYHPVAKTVAHRYRTWCEGFDAAIEMERTGLPVKNPYTHNKQSETWQSGFNASLRVTTLAFELKRLEGMPS